MLFIGITGKAKQGKSTAGQLIIHTLQSQGFDVNNFSISWPFKSFWADCVGMSLAELELRKEEIAHPYDITHRVALEQLGDWGRAVDKHFWLNALEASMKQRTREPDFVIVPDVRVQDEADWIRSRGVLLHITSTVLPTIDSTHTVQSNPIPVLPGDLCIVNDGTVEELHSSVKNLNLASIPHTRAN